MIDYPKVDLGDINSRIFENSALICFASFEKRCYTLAERIDKKYLIRSYIFRNISPPMDEYNNDNFTRLHEFLPGGVVKQVDLNDPVSVADETFDVIFDIQRASVRNIIIDISTFTHETLLMIMKVVYTQKEAFDSILLIYNGASKYASWLSMGCKRVRNIIGFPGLMNPAKKNHLVVLTGFEKERATKLVELYEPDMLTIGFGVEPTDKNHSETMGRTKDALEKWFDNLGISWNRVDFSCRDIRSTMGTLKEIIDNGINENIILVPLNTKLSTVSVAIVALNNQRVKVLYPEPETYNCIYSEPSNSFTVINLKEDFPSS